MEKINNSMESGSEKEAIIKAFEEMPQAQKFEMAKSLFSPEEAALLDNADYKMIFNTAERYLERETGATAIEDALVVGAIARAEALNLMGGKSMKSYVVDREGQIIGIDANDSGAIQKAKDLRQE